MSSAGPGSQPCTLSWPPLSGCGHSPEDSPGWLHALSVLTFLAVTAGLIAAVKRNIPSHKAFMRGSYFGVLGAFIGVVAVPERGIPQLAIHDLPLLILWVAALLLTAALAVVGTVHLAPSRSTAVRG